VSLPWGGTIPPSLLVLGFLESTMIVLRVVAIIAVTIGMFYWLVP